MTDKEKELKKENDELKQLLKQTMMAMCDYRTQKGMCAPCKTAFLCKAKVIIPKVQKALKIKR